MPYKIKLSVIYFLSRVNCIHAIANMSIQINTITIRLFVFIAIWIRTKLKSCHSRHVLSYYIDQNSSRCGTHMSVSSSSSILPSSSFPSSSHGRHEQQTHGCRGKGNVGGMWLARSNGYMAVAA